MCGIAGVINPRHPRAAEETLAALDHRGPDARGLQSHEGPGWSWQLFHTRLSIVDLSPAGQQPISNEDGSLVMIFNGEIYNSPELRRYCEAKGHLFSSTMDGEVILHLWEMEGAGALDRLNGIFAVAIASTTSGEVVVARDPIGVKPLFYSTRGDSLWFASELTALRATGAPMGPVDSVALAQFLSFLWIPDPNTPFAGAKKLMPGQALLWTVEGARLFSFGRPMHPTPERRDAPRRVVEETGERVSEAARRQLMADVPIGLMASGGIDSGLLWWAAKDGLDEAYTIKWTGKDGSERLHEDAAAVAELQRRFRTPVRYIDGAQADPHLVPPSGDLLADPAHDLTRLIARTAREHGHKVLLSGQGGDELFAGYRRHRAARWIARPRLGPFGRLSERALGALPTRSLKVEYLARLARASAEPDAFRAYMQLCTYSSAGERAAALDCDETEVSDDIVWESHRSAFDSLPDGLSFVRKVLTLDLLVYLPGLGLTYVDRAGMESGVEIRVPWLDLDFVRWTLSLPDEVLIPRGSPKWLTRELASRELSPALARRPKRAFASPVDQLRKAELEGGERGFRQGTYFARARRVLEAFLTNPPSAQSLPEASAP